MNDNRIYFSKESSPLEYPDDIVFGKEDWIECANCKANYTVVWNHNPSSNPIYCPFCGERLTDE